MADLTAIEIDLQNDLVRTPFGVLTERAEIHAGEDSLIGAWDGVRWRLEEAKEIDLSRIAYADLTVGRLRGSGRCVISYNAGRGNAEGVTGIRHILLYDPPGIRHKWTREEALAAAHAAARMASLPWWLWVGVCAAIVGTTWAIVWFSDRRWSLGVTGRLALGVSLTIAVGTLTLHGTRWCEWYRMDAYIAKLIDESPPIRQETKAGVIVYTYANGASLGRAPFAGRLAWAAGEAALLSIIVGAGAMALRSRRR